MNSVTDERKIREVMGWHFKGAKGLYMGELVKDFLPKFVQTLEHPKDLQFLWEIKDFVSADDFTTAVRVAWDSEANNSYREYDFPKEKVLEIFDACNPLALMTAYEYRQYQDLPDVVTVYCGAFGMDDAEPSEILSWTTALEFVVLCQDEYFGGSIDAGGYMASIRKEDIIAYLALNDYEVLLNPEKLFNITHLDSFAPIFESGDFWDSIRKKYITQGAYRRDAFYGELMKRMKPLWRVDELIAATKDVEKLKALADEFGVNMQMNDLE